MNTDMSGKAIFGGQPDVTGLKPARNIETRDAYRREAGRLMAKVDPDRLMSRPIRLLNAVRGFAAAHGRWAKSTIRLYRAALRQEVQDLMQSGELDALRSAELHDAIHAGPQPRPSSAPRQTSALKRRSVSAKQRNQIVTHLFKRGTPTTRLLARLVFVSSIIPIRPGEWRFARVVHGGLLIRCAKTSNGRGIAASRLVSINDPTLLAVVGQTIAGIRSQAAGEGGWTRLYARLARSLTRACNVIGVRPICLYTLRHQAIATAKKHFCLRTVAALAGHASVATPTHSYAKRRSGWRDRPKIEAPQRLLDLVRTPRTALRRGQRDAVRGLTL